METSSLKKQVRALIIFFIVALVISGVTAFPILWEISIINTLIGPSTFMEALWPAMAVWIAFVYEGINATYDHYPFIAYGTDWLAFAHIVIAIAFIGPLQDPVRNIWVIEFGMIACVLVIPLALIWGPIRGIPFFWRLFDCSFGVFGIIPLLITHRKIRQIIAIEEGAR